MAQEIIGNRNGEDFYVGTNNAPAPTPVAPPVTRYTTPTTPTAAPLPTPQPTSYNGNPILDRPTGPAPVDENAIREQTRQRMQSSIDAITANYANLISREEVQGQGRAGQTRAINARSGTLGQDFGNAQQEKTNHFNQQQVKSLEDEKSARVNSVLLNIEDRASSEIQARKAEALGQYERDTAAYKEAQEQARNDLSILAKSGVDLESLQPAQRAALLKQAGYEDNDMTSLIYNAMKPKPQQIDYKFEKLADGKGMFYGVDPVTGALVTKNVSVDLPPDWQMQIAPDGTVLGYDKNTGEAKVLSNKGEFAKPEDPLDQALKTAQIQKILNDIANGQGDEALSPTDAKTLGVPYGTTKGEAATLGIIPSGPLSAEAQKLKANVTSGLASLKIVKRELYGDENKDLTQPGDVRSNIIFRSGVGMAREYTSATKELKDILVRLRTGAAISESEEKYYQEQLPMLTDNEATVRSKLKRFEDLFNNLGAQADSSVSTPQDLFNEFEGGGSEGANPKAKSTGMRTDRHNNPTAFTTDIAKLAGLKEGTDYVAGDPFSNGKYRTAKLLGDPVATTIKVIDKIGFYTQSGNPRWTYVNSIPQAKNWGKLSYNEKASVIKQMYKHEGGTQLLKNFA